MPTRATSDERRTTNDERLLVGPKMGGLARRGSVTSDSGLVGNLVRTVELQGYT